MEKQKKWILVGIWVLAVLPIFIFLIPTWIKYYPTQFGYTYLTVLFLGPFIALCTTLVLSAIDRVYVRLEQNPSLTAEKQNLQDDSEHSEP